VWSFHKAPAPIIQDHFSFLPWSVLLPKFLSLKPYVIVAVVNEAVTKMLQIPHISQIQKAYFHIKLKPPLVPVLSQFIYPISDIF
jgi:hypothetical protein